MHMGNIHRSRKVCNTSYRIDEMNGLIVWYGSHLQIYSRGFIVEEIQFIRTSCSWSYLFNNAVFRHWIVLVGALWFAIAFPRLSQTCMLYRGEVWRKSTRQISSRFRKSSTRWYICDHALPSIKMKWVPTAPLKRWTLGSKTGTL